MQHRVEIPRGQRPGLCAMPADRKRKAETTDDEKQQKPKTAAAKKEATPKSDPSLSVPDKLASKASMVVPAEAMGGHAPSNGNAEKLTWEPPSDATAEAVPFLRKMLPWLHDELLAFVKKEMPELTHTGQDLTSLTQLHPLKITGEDAGYKEVMNETNMRISLQSMRLYEAGGTVWMTAYNVDKDEDNESWQEYVSFAEKAGGMSPAGLTFRFL